MDDTMSCPICHEEKHWRRFRMRNNDGTYRESDTCSTCRTRIANAKSAKRANTKLKLEKQVVLNRIAHQTAIEQGIKNYYPKIEKMVRSYCSKQTAMDRKYLRDVESMRPVYSDYLKRKRHVAIERAKGWIAFYDDIAHHAIQLLRETGARPSMRSMEQSIDAQLLYGLQNTKRARRLRGDL